MSLIAVETGTKVGYENYHGEIYDNDNLVTEWNYDKRQSKYICKIDSEKLDRGYKRIYANSVAGLVFQVQNILDKISK